MTATIGTKIVITWGLHAGKTATIVKVEGTRNFWAALDCIELDVDLRDDHFEVSAPAAPALTDRNGVVIAAGQYVRRYDELYFVTGIENNRALCLRVNPCNGRTRKNAKPAALRAELLEVRV